MDDELRVHDKSKIPNSKDYALAVKAHLGLTLAGMSRVTGAARSTVQRWEMGTFDFKIATAMKMSNLLQIPIEAFVQLPLYGYDMNRLMTEWQPRIIDHDWDEMDRVKKSSTISTANFAIRARILRALTGRSALKAAEAADIKASTYRRWENGLAKPSFIQTLQMGDALLAPPDILMVASTRVFTEHLSEMLTGLETHNDSVV